MTNHDIKQTAAYNQVRDAIELKAVSRAASLTKGARRIGGSIRKELRERASDSIRAARRFNPAFARRIWSKHR